MKIALLNEFKQRDSYRTGDKPCTAQVLMGKNPVSIALSNDVLEKIDKETSKQKRSRIEYVELHFELEILVYL
jgi:hypothetical protein